MTISDALKRAEMSIDRRDAQYLLANLLSVSRASLVANADRPLSKSEQTAFDSQVAARAQGTPVAYLLGAREFYGRDFSVNEHVLIPRPETEILVEQALVRLLEANCLEHRAPSRVLDLGTGSGAIAVTLALESPLFRVTACDLSPDALDVAARNATSLGAQVEFVVSDWYSAFDHRKFDLIVANPPYVAGGDEHLSQGDLRFEPQIALTDSSVDGLSSIRRIVAGAPEHMTSGGWLLFEHGYDQAEACRALLLKAGFGNLTSVADLAGIPRVAAGQIG